MPVLRDIGLWKLASTVKEKEEAAPLQRPPSPPSSYNIRCSRFPAHKPRDLRIPSPQAITHVAWSCDGKRLAGIETNVRTIYCISSGATLPATHFSGGDSDDVDYISWNPTHPELFCTSSQKDRRIVFGMHDAKSRYTQQMVLKISPVQTNYSPDGRTLIFTSAGLQLFFLTHRKDGDATKAHIVASAAMFNHVGDGIILTHYSEHSLTLRESPAAHVGGCVAVALDPQGRYLASGGYDSIVNMFDLSEWICARTISTCENAINALSFSYDGEYLAIAYATETGAPLHRVPALAPSPTVTWHPSKYVFAYCGQTKLREGGPPPVAIISLLGGGI
ncbi:WD40-repeat-containing domain protein [Suillus fuscotomentosus]|uniref:WD40-repeat-containing domain protein n=1 Tax=Suillus fuscotomentosus TaxID=1912939 RepID=A0AAD4HJJ6_9AGAM|nr:WD40-repeat-containing domain protein [Suillus fuscotomentosus]KAG1898948.1 WD40-repeat-containing domain protein [Suillus fuscotomentosus]